MRTIAFTISASAAPKIYENDSDTFLAAGRSAVVSRFGDKPAPACVLRAAGQGRRRGRLPHRQVAVSTGFDLDQRCRRSGYAGFAAGPSPNRGDVLRAVHVRLPVADISDETDRGVPTGAAAGPRGFHTGLVRYRAGHAGGAAHLPQGARVRWAAMDVAVREPGRGGGFGGVAEREIQEGRPGPVPALECDHAAECGRRDRVPPARAELGPRRGDAGGLGPCQKVSGGRGQSATRSSLVLMTESVPEPSVHPGRGSYAYLFDTKRHVTCCFIVALSCE